MDFVERAPLRRGSPASAVRLQLIAAAEELLGEEGFVALTAGRLAATLGLKRQIVHYYFGTIEDLVIEVIHRRAERLEQLRDELIAAPEPLRLLWESGHSTDPVTFELMALAPRRPAIRAALAHYISAARGIIDEAMATRGEPLDTLGRALAMAILSLSQGLAIDRSLGLDLGAGGATALVEEWLAGYAAR